MIIPKQYTFNNSKKGTRSYFMLPKMQNKQILNQNLIRENISQNSIYFSSSPDGYL